MTTIKRIPQAIDPSQSLMPIFRTTSHPAATLDQFFSEASQACYDNCYDEPQGFFLQTNVTLSPDQGTSPPTEELKPMILEDWTYEEIIEWSNEHLNGTTLSPVNLVILDERSAQDQTCVVCSAADMPEVNGRYQILRSDFESSLVSLRAKEVGVAGDEMFGTGYEGFDGVFRMSVRDEAEQRAKDVENNESRTQT